MTMTLIHMPQQSVEVPSRAPVCVSASLSLLQSALHTHRQEAAQKFTSVQGTTLSSPRATQQAVLHSTARYDPAVDLQWLSHPPSDAKLTQEKKNILLLLLGLGTPTFTLLTTMTARNLEIPYSLPRDSSRHTSGMH